MAKKKYKEKFNPVAEEMTANGNTIAILADLFNVTEKTINEWMNIYPEFFASIKRGRKIANKKVKKSLFQRATGYSHPDIHISNYKGAIIKTPILKHYPPDVTAQIFWLKCRDPENWRDVQEHELGKQTLAAFLSVLNKDDRPEEHKS